MTIIFLFFQVEHSLDQYIDLFFSFSNPILFLLLFLFIFIAILFLTSRNIIRPMKLKHEQEKVKHKEEKVKLELEKARLSAMFAELDPDPLVRIDANGIITSCNNSAKRLLGLQKLDGMYVFDVIKKIIYNPREIIERQEKIDHIEIINGRHYSVHTKGIRDLKFVQIYFHDITKEKEDEKKLENYQQKLRELSRDIQSKTEAERRRIAAELHDSVGQQLSLLKLKAQQISSEEASNNGKEQADILEIVDNITNEVRSILYQLKPKILDELGLGAAITSLIDRVRDETGINGSVDLIGNAVRFYPEYELNIFRVIQESVNNIIKHSKADEFSVQLIYIKEKLRIIVTDNGIGFNYTSESNSKIKRGYGLINMYERIESLGGQLKIDSNPDQGTIVLLEIPKLKEVRND